MFTQLYIFSWSIRLMELKLLKLDIQQINDFN